MKRLIALLTSMMVACSVLASAPPVLAATDPGLPSHAAIVSAGKRALDYYRGTYATTTFTPKNGWSWGTYFEGVVDFYRHAGDARYFGDGMAWGASNAWGLNSDERNPNTDKAGQVYYDLNQTDPSASLAAMDARMSGDLTGLPPSAYDWIDALFMGLPSWALWSTRTGDAAYLDKLDAFYLWTRDNGATSARCTGTPAQPGLYDATARLWYRDCHFVGARDADGKPIFWSRGNGWVAAAMADTIRALPAGSPRAAKYADMLRAMAAGLAPLQGADGFWRASLANPAAFPQPETSGTALFTYAMAYGIRTGILDAATYRPVVNRAWHGLSTMALQPSGFLTYCQPQSSIPAVPYTAPAPRTPATATSSGTVNIDSQPFCVGAFLLAAGQVAQLSPNLAAGRPVTATAQQAGNEAPRAVDGNVTTRWSATPFPQSLTVDLGSVRTVGSTMVVPYQDRAYRYRIESSTDRTTWKVLVDRSANTRTGSQLDDFSATPARYVRLAVLGASGVTTTWTSIQEFAIYPPASTVEPATYAADTFARTVSNGLGTASIGGAWQVVGTRSNYSVDGSVGRLRMGAPGARRSAFLPAVSATNVDVTLDCSFDKAPTGRGIDIAVVARHNAAGDYRVRVRTVRSGAVTLTLARTVNGVETSLASQTISGLTLAPNQQLRIRLQVVGTPSTSLRARAWRTTAPQPDLWQVAATDTTTALQAPGSIGVWTYLSGSATNAPVVVSVDNLTAVSAS